MRAHNRSLRNTKLQPNTSFDLKQDRENPRTWIKINGMRNAAIRFNKANIILESDMIQECSRLALLGPHPSRSQACSNDHR